MANDLLIQINADASNAQKAFDDIRGKTEDLESQLEKVAVTSGLAFAALTLEVYESVKAFENAQVASVTLSTALQNQGIFTQDLKDTYVGYAEALSEQSGISAIAIEKAQATAQAYLGQTEITEELTKAIVDFGAKMGGDVNGAAELIGRTIGTNTNAFARHGLIIDATATKQERMAAVMEYVTAQSNDFGKAINEASGYSKALGTAFEDLQKALGARFAPVVAEVRLAFIELYNYIASSPVLLDLGAAFIAAGLAVTGTIAALAAAVPAFLALSAAATAFSISMNAALFGIPLLVGAAVASITYLALNWNQAMNGIKAAAVTMATAVSELFGGLGKIFDGFVHRDWGKLSEGLSQLENAFSKAADEGIDTYEELTQAQTKAGVKQNAAAKAFGDKRNAIDQEHQRNLLAIRETENDLLQLETENASKEIIDLKTKELATLKALDNQHNKDEHDSLVAKLGVIRGLEDTQESEDLEKQKTFGNLQNQTKDELGAEGIEITAKITKAQQAQLQGTVQTELQTNQKLQTDLLAKNIAAHNTELLETKKYGAAYAVINKAMHSDEMTAANDLANDLAGLANSKNETLKKVGQVGASAQIAIHTAQGAVAAFSDSVTLFGPVAGPIIGTALAGALIAYGVEQEANLWAAAAGGMVTGGTPGVDSVKSLYMPGELIVPAKNFTEVVSSFVSQKGADAGGNSAGNAGGPTEIILSLKDDLGKFVEATLVKRQRLGVSTLTTKLTG